MAGNGFVREYGAVGEAAKVAVASVIAAFSGELRLPQMFTRHFQSRASGKLPLRAAQRLFLPVFPVV